MYYTLKCLFLLATGYLFNQVSSQSTQILNASTIEGASCNETANNCLIICDGDDRCKNADIDCPTNENCEYCSLNCTGDTGDQSSCESSTFDGHSCKIVEIFLESKKSGKKMTVFAPSDGTLKVTATDQTTTNGDETLRQSEFYSGTNTEAMYFYIYNSNGDKEFQEAYIDASNANYLEINCYNGAQCDEMTIYCPTNSTLNDDYFDDNNNPRPCTINCDRAICETQDDNKEENVLEIVSDHWEDDIDLSCSGGSLCNFTVNCNGGSCTTANGNICSGGCQPTPGPTLQPTLTPSNEPTFRPSSNPSTNPSQSPSNKPTTSPEDIPTYRPSTVPTSSPSDPTSDPTDEPTPNPTDRPTNSPTDRPTAAPTPIPTSSPSNRPTQIPSDLPSRSPSSQPSEIPSTSPTKIPSGPSPNPTSHPSNIPTVLPSNQPSRSPSDRPTDIPTRTLPPSNLPSMNPTVNPPDNGNSGDSDEFSSNSQNGGGDSTLTIG